jgi:hypothetical protein
MITEVRLFKEAPPQVPPKAVTDCNKYSNEMVYREYYLWF